MALASSGRGDRSRSRPLNPRAEGAVADLSRFREMASGRRLESSSACWSCGCVTPVIALAVDRVDGESAEDEESCLFLLSSKAPYTLGKEADVGCQPNPPERARATRAASSSSVCECAMMKPPGFDGERSRMPSLGIPELIILLILFGIPVLIVVVVVSVVRRGRPGNRLASPLAAAGWFADPTGRHQQRYWDGSRWTDAVSDDGVQASDSP